MQGTEIVVRVALCLAGEDFHILNEKFRSRLCGNECFGLWPKYNL